ncbi:MAG TPA: YkuS family protein [Bacillales bacterium]|nr:YkuS family protein [Bacillales bacterium]
MTRIGVEQTLTDVQQALSEKGFDIVPLMSDQDASECDCCVISGQDENVMGIDTIETKGPVIDARGMSADEICKEVESRTKH